MSEDNTVNVEEAARAWWELLRLKTGTGVPWEEASEEAKESVREYIEAPRG